ncbi:MAG: hypothetical protein COS95_07525, partial [Ignavibacteriales bacterium CG07_land_8_20_14_0_80_59_12]
SGGATAAAGGRFYSPLVLSIAHEERISMDELERISGTGGGGRVTKKDILQYKEQKKGGVAVPPQPVSPAPAPFGPAPAAASASGPAELRQKYPAPA